jgi:hypothetical protein
MKTRPTFVKNSKQNLFVTIQGVLIKKQTSSPAEAA